MTEKSSADGDGAKEAVKHGAPDSWLHHQRGSTRLAFILQTTCRIGTSLLSLLWTPLLLHSMGKGLYGLFLSFQSIASLGGLGDLGLGGVVSIQTSRFLGQGDKEGLRTFLATARTLFLILAVVVTGTLLVLSPWLWEWLHFGSAPGTGSQTVLFALGALSAGLLVISSYLTNLNYGLNNITWPVLPTFFLMQLSFLGHWLLAQQKLPLWLQFLPYLLAAVAGISLNWLFVRWSFPMMSTFLPLRFIWSDFRAMLAKSFWVYFYCIGGTIYASADILFINAAFGAEQIPAYKLNFKLCEVAIFVICSASLVSMPKITQWIASPQPADRDRAVREVFRLNKLQTFLGCTATLVYLAGNDFFIRHWLGDEYRASLYLQGAFAAQMAVTVAGYTGYCLAPRCGEDGIRVGGIAVAVAAMVKVALTFASVQAGSILGIPLSTVLSQSGVVLFLSWYACRYLKVSFWRFALKDWVVSITVVAAALFMRILLPPGTAGKAVLLACFSAGTLVLCCWILGLRRSDFSHEWAALRSLFARPKSDAPRD